MTPTCPASSLNININHLVTLSFIIIVDREEREERRGEEVISPSCLVYLLEDETLSRVGQPPTHGLFVNAEAAQGRVVRQA